MQSNSSFIESPKGAAQAKSVTIEQISKYFHLPMKEAVQRLGICRTLVKRICEENGVQRWPFRKIRSVQRRLDTLPPAVVTLSTAAQPSGATSEPISEQRADPSRYASFPFSAQSSLAKSYMSTPQPASAGIATTSSSIAAHVIPVEAREFQTRPNDQYQGFANEPHAPVNVDHQHVYPLPVQFPRTILRSALPSISSGFSFQEQSLPPQLPSSLVPLQELESHVRANQQPQRHSRCEQAPSQLVSRFVPLRWIPSAAIPMDVPVTADYLQRLPQQSSMFSDS